MKTLSKRGSFWQSIYDIPNMTRPQSWQLNDLSPRLKVDGLQDVVSEIVLNNFFIKLTDQELESLMNYIEQHGKNLVPTVSRLRRIIGDWLLTEYAGEQTEVFPGFTSMSALRTARRIKRMQTWR